ncbi:MAG: coproporphyrinogen-III oxidase family protein, partial [Elusimicrobiota bacterium]
QACEFAPAKLTSIYFGGGPPSILKASRLADLAELINKVFSIAQDAEWTLEAHPATLLDAAGSERAHAWRSMGFNRISMGAESLVDTTLLKIQRGYDSDGFRKACALARSAGLHNINIDLIAGWPWESKTDFTRSLRSVLTMAPEHISVYPLSLEQGTPMTQQGSRTDPDTQADLMISAGKRLTGAGYRHYEIANFCKPKKRCKHNLLYWQSQDYLAAGLAAAGKFGNHYWNNFPGMRAYLDSCAKETLPVAEESLCDAPELERRRLIMGLRLDMGVSRARLARLLPAGDYQRFRRQRLLTGNARNARMTAKGWLLSNQVMSALC